MDDGQCPVRVLKVPRVWTEGHRNFRVEEFTNMNNEVQLPLNKALTA